jgi:tRNA (cytidine/uridine-2'-O-)-methyltransferase
VKPLGFSLREKALRRAGLDYWDKLRLETHKAFKEIEETVPREKMYFFSKTGTTSLYDVEFKKGDYLVFGCETYGLPDDIRETYRDRLCCIPIQGDIRSLNLANSVAVAVYEGVRQLLNHK